MVAEVFKLLDTISNCICYITVTICDNINNDNNTVWHHYNEASGGPWIFAGLWIAVSRHIFSTFENIRITTTISTLGKLINTLAYFSGHYRGTVWIVICLAMSLQSPPISVQWSSILVSTFCLRSVLACALYTIWKDSVIWMEIFFLF